MQTIPITKEMAVAAYKNADPKEKQLLENLLGKENLAPQKITERVKTFEDACAISGFKPTSVHITTADESAYQKLKLIADVLNEGWKPDWTNSNEYKWVPYFDMKSGSGLSFLAADLWDSLTLVGSRLCFKSRELCEYAAKQFLDIYTEFFIIK